MPQWCVSILLSLIVFPAAIFSQTIDPAFAPVLQDFSSSSGSSRAVASLVQPDGKILVGGVFTVASGLPRSGIARFNADGTVDAAFDAGDISTVDTLTHVGDGGTIQAIALQPDGKIIIGGSFRRGNDTTIRAVERLNANGSPDATFQSTLFNAGVFDIVIQPDGKIVVGGQFQVSAVNPSNGQTVNFKNLARLNADGSFDFSFAANGLDRSNAVALLPDGKIVVANDSQTGLNPSVLNLYNPNGATLTELARFSGGGAEELEIQPDGKYVVAGSFTHVNGIFQRRIARINPDGSLDTTFNTGDGFTNGLYVDDVAIAPDGKIYIVGDFQIFNDATRWRVARLNANGSIDTTFNTGTPLAGNVAAVSILPDGRLFIGGAFPMPPAGNFYNNIARMNTDGTYDTNFNNANVTFEGEGYAIRQQPDGKVLIGGTMTAANGLLADGITRYNGDGTLDLNFFRNPDGGIVFDVERQSDGKILIAEGGAGVLLFRLNQDGSRDTSFSTPFVPFSASIQRRTDIKAVAVQPDNKILVGGQLITGSASSPSLSSLIRLNADGSRDTTFPLVGGSGLGVFVYDIAIQPDGKIVVGGNFSQLNGQSGSYLARVNPDGTIDNTFNASPPATVKELDLQPDGKIVFTSASSVFRVNSDGSFDAGFSPAAFESNGADLNLLEALQVLPGGKILVGGNFITVNGTPRNRIARLNANGSLDTGFNLPSGANNIVYDFSLQADGKILVSGAFTRLGGQPRTGAARLIDGAPRNTPFDFDGDGRADISVYRDGNWYLLQSTAGFAAAQFGIAADKLVPADYDGDGKTDLGVYRAGTWYLLRSTQGFAAVQFGLAEDIPQTGDFDGDGRADLAVFRPSNGTWYLQQSAAGFAGIQFGAGGDKAVAADYDGDGKTDVAVYRAGTWYVQRSRDGFTAAQFGISTDRPVVGDYDGDGKADYAVYRDGTWYLQRSRDGFTAVQFGLASDKPVPADFDGDGKTDVGVFRPGEGNWYILRSSQGLFVQQFGIAGDVPAVNAFIQ
jgi:uncharacterized delta-60 repeat protein